MDDVSRALLVKIDLNTKSLPNAKHFLKLQSWFPREKPCDKILLHQRFFFSNFWWGDRDSKSGLLEHQSAPPLFNLTNILIVRGILLFKVYPSDQTRVRALTQNQLAWSQRTRFGYFEIWNDSCVWINLTYLRDIWSLLVLSNWYLGSNFFAKVSDLSFTFLSSHRL